MQRVQRAACAVVVVAFLTVLVYGGYVMSKLNAAEARVAEAVELIRRKVLVVTTWNSESGSHEVKTQFREFDPNETIDQWAARHKAEVVAMQLQFPKI